MQNRLEAVQIASQFDQSFYAIALQKNHKWYHFKWEGFLE